MSAAKVRWLYGKPSLDPIVSVFFTTPAAHSRRIKLEVSWLKKDAAPAPSP
jgi:hypothetical protein